MSAPTVVGLDPSLTAAGVASSAGWCETRGYDGITRLPALQRIAVMKRLAAEIIELVGRPDLVVIEAPAYSRAGGGSHERGWLWWHLYGSFANADIPVAVMQPNQRAIYATGKNAGKGVVIDAVARRWPDWETGGDDNCADAVVLMAAGLDHLGHPLAPMPATHRAVLDRIEWPDLIGVAA